METGKTRNRLARRRSDREGTLTSPPQVEEKQDLIARLQLPPELETAVRAVDIFSAIVTMRDGAFLQKYPRLRIPKKPHSRLFKADVDSLTLRWMSPAKSKNKTLINFQSVLEVNCGWNSKFWRLKTQKEKKLGIEIVAKSRYLRLVASSQTEWKTWMRGLVYIHERAHAKQRRSSMAAKDDDLRRVWNAVLGSSKAETIDLYGLVQILQRLKYHADVRYVETLFKMADEDGSQKIDYGGFQEVILRLGCPPELSMYFREYKEPTKDIMTGNDGFELFLKDVQQEPEVSISSLSKIVESMPAPFADQGNLTELGFSKLLMSDWNSIYSPTSTSQTHDMSRPLSQYWINACTDPFSTISHHFRRRATSMTKQFVFALMNGHRFLRILAKDGPNEEPVVFNAYDDCLPAKKVFELCRDYGFMASPFPLILYVKPFCTGKQIAKLGITIDDVLQQCLYVPRNREDPLPSPEDLSKKIIICSPISNDVDAAMDEYKILQTLYKMNRNDLKYGTAEWFKHPPTLTAIQEEAAVVNLLSPTDSAKVVHEQRSWFNKVIGLEHAAWPESVNSRDTKAHQVHALPISSRTIRVTDTQGLIEMNRNWMGLAYSEGTPALKTNTGFVSALMAGFQIVPISQQAGGFTKIVHRGLFTENASCGYVLRPTAYNSTEKSDRLAPGTKQPSEGPIELGVKILSGFQLPRGPCGHPTQKIKRHQPFIDTVDPYVVLSTTGPGAGNIIRKTQVVAHNGLDPQWRSQEFLFPVPSPSTAFLIFDLMHHDSVARHPLGGAAVRVSCIRPGIRWVPLHDATGRKIPWSGLLVEVSFKALKTATSPEARSKITAQVQRDKPQLAMLKFQLDDATVPPSPSFAKSPNRIRRKAASGGASPAPPEEAQVPQEK